MKNNRERPSELYDIVNLSFSHALVMGNAPEGKIPTASVSKKQFEERKEVGSFGLFDTATPNFQTYYPGVTKDDLNPEKDPNSFVYPVYRALSEVTVHKKRNPIYFSSDVLKASKGMLTGQTVYANHEMATGNELGAVIEEDWQDGYTTATGIKVPGGINTKFKIDGKSNPKTARSMMMEPPAAHSVSVTVEFAWEPSHKSIPLEEFWSKLGTYDESGQQYRRNVTQILRYHEISVVPHGADPYAKKIGADGGIVIPEYADSVYNSEGEKSDIIQAYNFSYKDITSFSEEKIAPTKIPDMNKELLALIGLPETATASEFQTALSAKLEENKTTVANVAALTEEKRVLTEAKVALENQVTSLTREKTDLAPLAEIGKAQLAELREETKKSYVKLMGDHVDATILATLENGDIAVLKALGKGYTEQLEAKFPLACNKCHSTEVSRQSSTTEAPKNENAPPKKLTNDETLAELRKMGRGKDTLFASEEEDKKKD